jgi:hypothetical protein
MAEYEKDSKWHSCMTGIQSEKVELYVNNPDRVSLVVFDERGRALLWNTDSGKHLMDRIFPNSGDHVGIMQRWAIMQGYVYRTHTVADRSDVSDHDIHSVTVEFRKYLPYLDTLRSVKYIGRKSKKSKRWVTLTNSGVCETQRDAFPPTAQCRMCKGYIWEDYDRHFTDAGSGPYCLSCLEVSMIVCAKCLDVYEQGNMVYIEDVCEFWCGDCHFEEGFTCVHCGHWFSSDYPHVIGDDHNVYCAGDACAHTCLHVCGVCGCVLRNIYYLVSGMQVCDACLNQNIKDGVVFTCPDCGNWDAISEGKKEDREENGNNSNSSSALFCSKCYKRRAVHKATKTADKKDKGKLAVDKPKDVVYDMQSERGSAHD